MSEEYCGYPVGNCLVHRGDIALVAAERLDALRGVIEDLVRQFAYPTAKDGVPALTTGGLSALEGAFAVLEWTDPYPCPEEACEMDGCGEWATSGTPTPDGYKRVCSRHFGDLTRRGLG